MALLAGERRMSPGQREFSHIVVELCPLPLCCVVAYRAILGKGGRHVIRVRRLVVVGNMARCAIGGRSREAPVYVTGVARHRCVGSRQGKLGQCVVVERCSRPADHVVADGTRL